MLPTIAAADRRGGGQWVGLVEVGDELLDGDDRDAVALAELEESGQAHHAAVLGDDLGDRADRLQPGEAHEVDGGLGVARALEHAAL